MTPIQKQPPAPVSQMAKPIGGGGVGSVLQQMQKPIPPRPTPQVQPKPQVPPKPIPPRPTPQVQPRPQIQPTPQVSPRPQLPQVASNPNMTQLNSNSQIQQLMKMLQGGNTNPSQLSNLLGKPQVQQPSNPPFIPGVTGDYGPVNKNPLVDPVTGNTLPQLGTVDFGRGGFGGDIGAPMPAPTMSIQDFQNKYIGGVGNSPIDQSFVTQQYDNYLKNQSGSSVGSMGGNTNSYGGLGGPAVLPTQGGSLGGFGSPQSPYATGAMAAGMGGNMATPYNSGSPIGGSGSTQPFGQTMGQLGMNSGGLSSPQNNMVPGNGLNNTSSSMQNLGLGIGSLFGGGT